MGIIFDKYQVNIIFVGWMFSIWGVIYVWEVVWIVYIIVNLFWKMFFGFLYCNFIFFFWIFFVCFMVNMCLNLFWIFFFDREYMIVVFVVLFFIVFILYVCMFILYCYFDKNIDFFRKDGRKMDIWCICIMVQNGFGVYVIWIIIVIFFNMVIVMIYEGNLWIVNDDVSIVVFFILVVEFLGYIFVDFVFLDCYICYIVILFCVVFMVLGVSLVKNYKVGFRNFILIIIMVVLVLLCLVVKVFFLIWCELRSLIKFVRIIDFDEDLRKEKVVVV